MGTAQAQDATTVQGTQSTLGAGAVTGIAAGGNNSNFAGGPTATAAGGASSQQLGKNTAKVSQTGTATTGDPVAGGQITGVVGDNATVQNSNSAAGVAAVSGVAVVANRNATTLGPSATSLGPAQSAQSGSNSLDLSQSGTTETGDAVAGGQVTGIVGEGEHAVQMQNSCVIGCIALSAPAAVVNINADLLGPTAASILPAQAGQVGDNDAVISQSSSTKTGDAIAGSQVTGGVGGSATVQNSNSCLGCLTATAPAIALNLNAVNVGPVAASVLNAQTSQSGDNSTDLAQDATGSTGDALSGSQVTGWVGDSNGFLTVMNQQASQLDAAFSGPVLVANANVATPGPLSLGVLNAQSSQNGDNDTVVAQATNGSGGDALAGAQVTGGVGGDITVSGMNSSIGTLALSSPVLGVRGVNFSVAQGGPTALALITSSSSQTGDNSVALDQSVNSETGDAVSGAQVVGAVADGDVTVMTSNQGTLALGVSGNARGLNVGLTQGGPISAGILNAQSQQAGDNDVSQSQSVAASSGDALTGGQTVGAVADGDVTISAQNSALLTFSVSGTAQAQNVSAEHGSPVALGVLNANASQLGDNDLALDTSISTASGDAVSGSQVLGSVAGGDVSVMNTNSGTVTGAVSGMSTAANRQFLVDGPMAVALIGASASQTGDTSLAFSQEVSATTGDAVAGSAVVGAVADGDITAMGSNSSTAALTVSGAAVATNAGFINGGPFAAGILSAQTQQFGSNSAAIAQSVTTETGDAVSGSQITGAVSNDGDIVVSNQNSSLGAVSLSLPSVAANAATLRGGPVSLGVLNASSSQFGSNSTALAQEVNSSTGDAVSGAQITGAVANGSDVTVMGSNSSVGALALSFPAVGLNVGVSQTGPLAFGLVGGSASQFGSNAMAVDQQVSVTTGDAVAGSQITGVVAADDGVVTISNQNSSLGALAISGPAIGPNFAFAVGGPVAGGLLFAQAQQTGDNTLDYSQDVAVASGDAVAGAQVSGVVGGRELRGQSSNSGVISLGLSGITFGFNNAGGGLTPTAVSLVSARVQQNGSSELNGTQDLDTGSGDAVSGGQIGGRVATGSSTTSGSSASPAGIGTTGVTTGTP